MFGSRKHNVSTAESVSVGLCARILCVGHESCLGYTTGMWLSVNGRGLVSKQIWRYQAIKVSSIIFLGSRPCQRVTTKVLIINS